MGRVSSGFDGHGRSDPLHVQALERRYRRVPKVAMRTSARRRRRAIQCGVFPSTRRNSQRASLALCVFGGLTHREAAALLDVPPGTVAALLTAGLRELGRLAAGGTATCA